MDLKKRECKRCAFVAGSILILIIAGFVAYNYSKTIGSVTYPVEANRQFLAASFSCANGASSDLTSKNCRSAAYWKNFADKFCRNLCEPTEDMNLDNLNVGNDHSCDMSVLHLFKECEGNAVQGVEPGSVQIGGDCTEDSDCVAGAFCDGAPYGNCAEIATTAVRCNCICPITTQLTTNSDLMLQQAQSGGCYCEENPAAACSASSVSECQDGTGVAVISCNKNADVDIYACHLRYLCQCTSDGTNYNLKLVAKGTTGVPANPCPTSCTVTAPGPPTGKNYFSCS